MSIDGFWGYEIVKGSVGLDTACFWTELILGLFFIYLPPSHDSKYDQEWKK